MLKLGPIVGHTTYESARIWIAVDGSPDEYQLELSGAAQPIPFRSTESSRLEFGTAMAEANGLSPDTRYAFTIRDANGAAAGSGSVRTFPPPEDATDLCFASASCDSLSVAGDNQERGAWDLLVERVRRGEPRFLILLGDQVYFDGEDDLWQRPFDIAPSERRQCMAEVYRRFWSRPPVAEVLANIPTYMMWDDHEIRNGWGSDPGDSPTLARRYPAGRAISARYQAFFEDAREVYWHFQHVRNPPTPGIDKAAFLAEGGRSAVPFTFRCGATKILVLDNRGARDVWRRRLPVLGNSQWEMLRNELQTLDATVDSLVVVVPLPVISMPNRGIVQLLLGHRRDDLRLFARNQAAKLKQFPETGKPNSSSSRVLVYLQAVFDLAGSFVFGTPGSGRFELKDLTDVRDNWAHHLVRRERNALVRAVLTTRASGSESRAVTFFGGDLHVGALMDLVEHGGQRVTTLITSGIGQAAASGPAVGTVLGLNFRVARGLRAKLVTHSIARNFGLTRIKRRERSASIAHELVAVTPPQ